jgi:hypothetical protein
MNYSNTTLYNGESPTVNVLPKGIKRIIKWNGIFYLGAETKDFIYFCNYQESCENANIIMYRKADRTLASDNYFASNDFIELMTERSEEITYASPTIKRELKIIEKDLEII